MMKPTLIILLSLFLDVGFGQAIAGEEKKIRPISKINSLKKDPENFLNTPSEERVYKLSYAQTVKTNNPYIIKVLEVYKRAGLKTELKPRPTLRALINADRGNADAEIGHTEDVMKDYPNLIKVDAQLFTFYGQAYVVNPKITSFEIEDIPKFRIGVKRGSYWTRDLVKNINVTQVESCNQLFDILIAGRIDVGLCPEKVFDNQIPEIRKRHKSVRALEPPIVKLPMFHYVHKKNKHLIPLLKKTIREMVAEGLIDPSKSWLK